MQESAQEQYSFTHFNCLHGVGHGLMLTLDADLWETIPYCATLDDDRWEYRSCLGGAFMENVVTAQGEGRDEATLRDDDLLYPCTALEGLERDECLLMQTSWVLYELDYDYAVAFGVCDGLDHTGRVTCYQSMGRDLSGNSRLDVDRVVRGCELGAEGYRWSCVRGAALNAVYSEHGTGAAEALCTAVDPSHREICDASVEEASSTF
ncbi:MAG: hypothetical protein U5R31_00430 [Acidimicrobiia bacterium]|nr:hypothetical protein [Acidimicrobiia bacterium]